MHCSSLSTGTSPPLSTNIPGLTMSVALPFRQFPSRSFGSWTCSACTRSLTRTSRARHPAFTARRCLNTTKPAQSSTVPRMDQMAAQYKIKNRTVMYAQSANRLCAIADTGQELCFQCNSRLRSNNIWLRTNVQDGTPPFTCPFIYYTFN
jgi:hypothetical protein